MIIKQLREIALAGAGGDMQAEPSNFLLERDAIVAACRKREGEGLSSNDTVGRGGEGRLSYSALEGGVGRTLQLYLARAAAAAAAARCQPVTPSVHRARNKQESGCIYRALPAKHPYQLPPFNSPSRKTTPKIGTNTKASGVVCLCTAGWRCNARGCVAASMFVRCLCFCVGSKLQLVSPRE